MIGHYTDAQRMELRSYVNLAGETVARLWPMRTFISRNPLQGLESLPFHEAVQRGEQLFGGRGYLPTEWYREQFREGRISPAAVEQVLQPLAEDKHVQFGDHRLSHVEVLRLALLHGITLQRAADCTTPGATDAPDLFTSLRPWAEAALPQNRWEDHEDLDREGSDDWLRHDTLASWCDRTLGATLVDDINRQMIKWCAAFCDEGEAAWPMPCREETFFRSWKAAARHDVSLRLLGIRGAAKKISALSDRPEDALLESLDALKVPPLAWQDYLSLHLAALPGWAGFIKWRAEQTGHPWQDAYRIDLVKYLAVRLFYERELVAVACRRALDCAGDTAALQAYARRFPHALWLRRTLVAGRLPDRAAAEAARLTGRRRTADARAWDELGRRWYAAARQGRRPQEIHDQLRALIALAEAVGMKPELMAETPPSDLATLLDWIRTFSDRSHSRTWLEASELTAERAMLDRLNTMPAAAGDMGTAVSARPLAQFVFCIDVRSEVFRRHLEDRGGYETFGFAGFFGLPVSFRSLDEPHESDLCPVLLKPKHALREVPRTYDGQAAQRRKATAQAAKVGHELLHDLKHNVVTPYVMVEAVGWWFGWPLLAKTLLPRWYHGLAGWLRRRLAPRVATTMTVDKLTSAEADEMVAADQRMRLQRWLRERFTIDGALLTPQVLERIRRQALEAVPASPVTPGELGHLLVLGTAHEAQLLEELRRECRISPRDTSARIERITRTGFTPTEQAYYVETALKLMGFTSSFARLVFLCGHGSTSQNNPYESALDCGACGGSQGLPNARTFATIANRPQVRQLLAARGLIIPADTHFVAAVHDTTTDRLAVEDLEDVPATHRKELAQVLEDVAGAGAASAVERVRALVALPGAAAGEARAAVERRSLDWAEVRPEWGLARNGWFIIGGRRLTRGRSLEGRSFLHSYDSTIDQDGKLLEVIMTAPLIVAQWINSEYYFSTVAPEVYGSGSKVYHNVTGRIGVMTGNHSDLRMGLPVQSLFDGASPYHEPLRLTAVIEAPRRLVSAVIARQPLLQQLFNNRWLRLVVLDPNERVFYRHGGGEGWAKIDDMMGAETADDMAEKV
ncbi:DUF2309 domain-containing protein [Nitrospira moscoviensis]|uniref:Probable inorganic carbon transporter subunit DabA n=1 Tax=Nitrospira moscoviensis TaxID=42253 RepID=A0A0K2GGC7_NITMO|nr:DUF2309 domain-containing protein [Nitrospira moscoviensis]ALA59682.1 hypothetical protein NITMOv2_3289 [Nitrospira moscoviensis]